MSISIICINENKHHTIKIFLKFVFDKSVITLQAISKELIHVLTILRKHNFVKSCCCSSEITIVKLTMKQLSLAKIVLFIQLYFAVTKGMMKVI